MKRINALCFLLIIVMAFCPIVSIAFIGNMNVIDFIIGPSVMREMGANESELINPENVLLILLPVVGLICSMASASEGGYIKAPIACLIAAIIGNVALNKLGETINTYSFAAEKEFGFTFMDIGYKGAFVISILMVLQALYIGQKAFFKVHFEKNEVIEKVKCRSCGCENNKNVEFCTNCGRKLNGEISTAQYKTCNNCGQENIKGAEYCINCGARIDKLICKACGSENEQDAEFCSYCGRRVKE